MSTSIQRRMRNRIGVLALAVLFVFGTLMGSLSFLALLFPSSPRKSIWRLNPDAHTGFLPLGGWALMLMASISLACGLAALGLLRYRRWGYWLALGIPATNATGDLAGAVLRSDPRTLIGCRSLHCWSLFWLGLKSGACSNSVG